MEIMDFHAHIYPEKIAEKATQNVGEFYKIPMSSPKGTAEDLIERGKKAGVGRFLVHSVATVPHQVTTINNFIAAECKKHNELTGFGAVHAEMENPADEIDRIESLGLKGIKIHPDTQHFNMDDPKMMKIYDLIRGRLPIVIHCGDYRYSYSHPKRLVKVLENFPDLTIIAAHFGGWSLWDLALEYLQDKVKNTNCFFDTSSSSAFLGKKRTYELIRAYGTDRILFGTDFPMWDAAQELERIYALNLTESEYEQILTGNAKRVLGEA